MERPSFRVDAQTNIAYCPLLDKHLEYYFASKNTRRILLRSKLINRRNEILEAPRLLPHGPLSHSFRLPIPCAPHSLNKQDFDAYLRKQKHHLVHKARKHHLNNHTQPPTSTISSQPPQRIDLQGQPPFKSLEEDPLHDNQLQLSLLKDRQPGMKSLQGEDILPRTLQTRQRRKKRNKSRGKSQSKGKSQSRGH